MAKALRRVCTRADEALRDEFRLSGWVQRPRARRDLYFAWCDRAARELSEFAPGAEPSDESLILTLVAALGSDESFAGHAKKRRRSTFLTDNANWTKLYRAGAATILEEYFDAVANGAWP